MIGFGNVFHHFIGNFIGTGRPDIDDLIIFFAFGDQTVLILLFKFLNLFFGFGNQLFLGIGNNQVIFTERNTGLAGVGEAERHQFIDKQHGFFLTAVAVNRINDFTDFFLFNQAVNQRERHVFMLRQNFRNDNAARRGFNQTDFGFAVIIDIFHTAFNLGMQIDRFLVQSHLDFVEIGKYHAFADHSFGLVRQIINTQNHILRRNDNRFTRSRRQNIVG